jgi:CRP/FNR family cyclic AMP-dependent transcriptional regulator
MFTHQTELLKGVPDTLASQILELGSLRSCQEGETVFSLGSEARDFFLVERGRVRLTLPMELGDQGEDIFVEERIPGQLLGWSALVPPFRFTLKGSAAEESQLLSIPAAGLLDLLALHPEAGHMVMGNLTGIIGKRLQMFQTMWVREIQRMVRMNAFNPQEDPDGATP